MIPRLLAASLTLVAAAATSVVGAVGSGCSATSDAPPAPTCQAGGPAPDTTCTAYDVLVAAGDYSSSAVGGFSLDGRGNLRTGVDLGKDPALAFSAGRAFFVARDQDLLFEIDTRCGLPRSKINVHDTRGAGGSNPQDVAVAPDGSLWVPRFNTPSILVTAPCGTGSRSIDLTPFDGDGNPNASAIRIVSVGGVAKAFVALERLDDRDKLLSKQPSTMLRIDVETAEVELETELAGRNPFGVMSESGGALYLAEPGNFDAVSEPFAGIERFDTSTSTSALIARETDLGGSVAIVAVAPARTGSPGCGAAIVGDATPGKNRTAVVTFDPATGRALTTFATPLFGPTDDYDLLALAWYGDVLLVGDRRKTSRGYPVHAFDRRGPCDLTPRPDTIFLELPPLAFAGFAPAVTPP